MDVGNDPPANKTYDVQHGVGETDVTTLPSREIEPRANCEASASEQVAELTIATKNFADIKQYSFSQPSRDGRGGIVCKITGIELFQLLEVWILWIMELGVPIRLSGRCLRFSFQLGSLSPF